MPSLPLEPTTFLPCEAQMGDGTVLSARPPLFRTSLGSGLPLTMKEGISLGTHIMQIQCRFSNQSAAQFFVSSNGAIFSDLTQKTLGLYSATAFSAPAVPPLLIAQYRPGEVTGIVNPNLRVSAVKIDPNKAEEAPSGNVRQALFGIQDIQRLFQISSRPVQAVEGENTFAVLLSYKVEVWMENITDVVPSASQTGADTGSGAGVSQSTNAFQNWAGVSGGDLTGYQMW